MNKNDSDSCVFVFAATKTHKNTFLKVMKFTNYLTLWTLK